MTFNFPEAIRDDNFFHDEMVKTLLHFHLNYLNGKNIYIAYSGGVDSHVLLSAYAALKKIHEIQLKVIHINHQLSPNSSHWVKHCRDVCKAYEIEFIERAIKIELQKGESLEEIARIKRYEIFAEYIDQNDVLVTAHHEDDQVETFFINLLRGSGMKGLSAMPALKPFAKGWQARPFLTISRDAIKQYALSNQLKWMEDESNLNVKLKRNFIRHRILTTLKNENKSAIKMVARSAMHCAQGQELLTEYAQLLIAEVKGTKANTLSVKKLLTQNLPKRRLIIRHWIEQQGFLTPNAKKLEVMCTQILNAKIDRTPSLHWGIFTLRRYRDNLFLMKFSEIDNERISNQIEYEWNVNETLFIPRVGKFSINDLQTFHAETLLSPVIVRFRQSGETVNLGACGKRKLKNLFQEWGIPPWERNKIPLVFSNDKLVGVLKNK